MPRIRKKTSKRGTLHKRARIQHKVAETQKKRKKEAKKNPQWKSKKPKDPGIPNNFPYKDQILAEVAAQRRQEEEARQLKKEQKKALKAGVNDENDADEDDCNAFDGISSVGTISKASGESGKLSAKGKGKAADMDVDDDDVPTLKNSDYQNMKAVLDKADVVLHVVDARDPLAYQSVHLQDYVKASGKGKVFLVLNKIDVCPRESVQAWAAKLRKEHPTFLFRSASAFIPRTEDQSTGPASKANETLPTSDARGLKVLLQALKNEASKKSDGPLIVALVGIANTGKSALVNSLLKKSVSTIYKLSSSPPGPSTTERALELTLEADGKQLLFIDTPALSWEPIDNIDDDKASQQRARDVLLRNKGRIDRAKDPITPVSQIVARANAEDLMVFYNLPAFARGDATAFLSALSRPHGLIKKHGELDLIGAARIVLRDWSTGKLSRYTQPPSSASSASSVGDGEPDSELAELYKADAEILSAAPLRRDMRRGAGLVKLAPGEAEGRKIALEAPWDESDDEEEEGDDDDDDDDEEDADADEDEDENGVGSDAVSAEIVAEDDGDEDVAQEVDEDEESDEDVPPPTTGKRKRQEKSAHAPSSKKVAFAAPPKGSKQARRAQPPSKLSSKTSAKATAKTSRPRK